MKIETVKDQTATTRVVTLEIADCPDLIERDWTDRKFRPVRMVVTIIDGAPAAFMLSGPRVLKSGKDGEIITQRFYASGRSLGGSRAPQWAVDVVERVA